MQTNQIEIHIFVDIFAQRKIGSQQTGESSRPKRTCIKTNRLGKRESTVNHNAFFENLNASKDRIASDQDLQTGDSEHSLVVTATCGSPKDQNQSAIIIDDSISSVSQLESSKQRKCCIHDAEFKTVVIAH